MFVAGYFEHNGEIEEYIVYLIYKMCSMAVATYTMAYNIESISVSCAQCSIF